MAIERKYAAILAAKWLRLKWLAEINLWLASVPAWPGCLLDWLAVHTYTSIINMTEKSCGHLFDFNLADSLLRV